MAASTTPRKRVAVGTVDRPQRNAGNRPRGTSAASASRAEKHLGATEAQVGVTMPPRPDDDEPKQG